MAIISAQLELVTVLNWNLSLLIYKYIEEKKKKKKAQKNKKLIVPKWVIHTIYKVGDSHNLQKPKATKVT